MRRWIALGVGLVGILAGAIAFSLQEDPTLPRHAEPPPALVPLKVDAPTPPPTAPTPMVRVPTPMPVVKVTPPTEPVPPLQPAALLPSDQKAFRRTVESRQAEFQSCYQSWSQRNPGASPRLRFEIQLSRLSAQDSAAVDRVTVLSNSPDKDSLGDCVRRIFEADRFAPPPMGPSASIIFHFMGQVPSSGPPEPAERPYR